MRKKIRKNRNSTQAFTLLEVMITISIFGLLMLYASQFMRSEVNVFQSVSRQNEVEQKARIAMMHIVDEVRLTNLTFYKSTSNNQGIYRYANAAAAALRDETDSTSLIFIKLPSSSDSPPSSAKVFFDYDNSEGEGTLWYIKNGFQYLIADEISQLSIIPDATDEHLVKIDIIVGGKNRSRPYELLTWVRLY